jgi:hypothetical protein
MRQAEHIALVVEKRDAYKFWSGIQKKKRYHLEDLDVDRSSILEGILGKESGKIWTVFVCFRIETSGGLLWTRQ